MVHIKIIGCDPKMLFLDECVESKMKINEVCREAGKSLIILLFDDLKGVLSVFYHRNIRTYLCIYMYTCT